MEQAIKKDDRAAGIILIFLRPRHKTTPSSKIDKIPSRPLPRFCQSFKYQEEKQRCLRSIIKPVRI